MKLIYTAYSKHSFYFRLHISKFVIEQGCIPINPFMIFEYFMLDTVERDDIASTYEVLIKKCDETWVFGPISDGVFAEINIAKRENKPVRYFSIIKSRWIREISKDEIEFEDDVKIRQK